MTNTITITRPARVTTVTKGWLFRRKLPVALPVAEVRNMAGGKGFVSDLATDKASPRKVDTVKISRNRGGVEMARGTRGPRPDA